MVSNCRMGSKTSSECDEYKVENNIVFPNPTAGKFSITLKSGTTADVDIYDINGTKIYSLPRTGPDNEIDLTGFSSGLYFIRIRLNNKMLQQKLILL